MEELRHQEKAEFITLTFSESSLHYLSEDLRKAGCEVEGYEFENEVAKLAVKRWSDRWKKKFGKRPRRWLITELGGDYSQRIHLHGILWEDITREDLEDTWSYGNVWIGDYVNESTVNYIVKYMMKVDKKHKKYKPRILTSPGMGAGYKNRVDFKMNKFDGEDTRDYYRLRDGRKTANPIYYRNMLYSEEEREYLWIRLLDKNIRYLDGKEYDVSTDKGMEIFNTTMEYKRKENKILGYGDNSKYDELGYQKQWRALQRLARKKKVENGSGGSY